MEKLKIEHGSCASETLNNRSEFDLFEYGAFEHDKVKEKEITMIISARIGRNYVFD